MLSLANSVRVSDAVFAAAAAESFWGSYTPASGNGDQGLNRLLEVVLGLLELGRLAPDRRQGGGLYRYALGALRESVPRHPAQGVEHRRIERDGVRVVGDLARGHAAQRAGVLALQGHRRLPLFDQYLGLDLRKGGERVSRPERQGKSGQHKPLLH